MQSKVGVVPQSELCMRVNLYISGRSLKDLDVFSKSDPVCTVYEKVKGKWIKHGSTERINDNLNPDFQTALTLPYFFEKKQELKFEMIDDDGKGTFDLIGAVETTMGTILGAKKQMYEQPLLADGKANRGKILVRAEAIQSSNFTARFKIIWKNLNNVAGFCCGKKRVPVKFKIGRQIPGTSTFAEVFTTQLINQQSPDYELPLQ